MSDPRRASRVRSLMTQMRRWSSKRREKNLEYYTLEHAIGYLNHYAYILEHVSDDEIQDLIDSKRGRSA